MVAPIVIGQVIVVLELFVGLAATGLAFQGYRRNNRRSMLVLGGGIAMMTVVGTSLQLILTAVTTGPMVAITPTVTDLLGICLLLYAIVLARRE